MSQLDNADHNSTVTAMRAPYSSFTDISGTDVTVQRNIIAIQMEIFIAMRTEHPSQADMAAQQQAIK